MAGRLAVWSTATNSRVEFSGDDREGGLDVAGWSPDDTDVVVFRRYGRQETELLAYPSRGGPPRALGRIAAELARSVRLNPAGTRISFEAGSGDWTAWVMRGFFDAGAGRGAK